METIFETLVLCLVCGRLPGVNSLMFCDHSSVCSWPGHREGSQSTWLLGSQTEQGWPLTVTRSEAERHMAGRRERKLFQGGPHREDGRATSQRPSPECWKYVQGYIRKMGGKREGVPAGRLPRLNLSLSGSPSGVGSFWLRQSQLFEGVVSVPFRGCFALRVFLGSRETSWKEPSSKVQGQN